MQAFKFLGLTTTALFHFRPELWEVKEKVGIRIVIDVEDGSIGQSHIVSGIFLSGRCRLTLGERGRAFAQSLGNFHPFRDSG